MLKASLPPPPSLPDLDKLSPKGGNSCPKTPKIIFTILCPYFPKQNHPGYFQSKCFMFLFIVVVISCDLYYTLLVITADYYSFYEPILPYYIYMVIIRYYNTIFALYFCIHLYNSQNLVNQSCWCYVPLILVVFVKIF